MPGRLPVPLIVLPLGYPQQAAEPDWTMAALRMPKMALSFPILKRLEFATALVAFDAEERLHQHLFLGGDFR